PPALKRPHRPRRDRDHGPVEPDLAAADPVLVHERLEAEDALAGGDLPLDDPVERTAVEDLGRAFGRHPGDVDVPRRRAAALRLRHPFLYPFAQVAKRIRADAELDEVQGHGPSLADGAPAGPARPRRYPHGSRGGLGSGRRILYDC